MRAREAAEAAAREASAPTEAPIVPPIADPEVNPDAVNEAAPAVFAAPRERSNNLIHKTKQLGIAGLFSDENEVDIFDESDSEASTSGAAPASPIESDEDETPLGKFSKTRLRLRKTSALLLKLSPGRGTITSLRCLVSLTTKANLTVPKSSPIAPTVGSPLTLVWLGRRAGRSFFRALPLRPP